MNATPSTVLADLLKVFFSRPEDVMLFRYNIDFPLLWKQYIIINFFFPNDGWATVYCISS